MCMCIIVPSGAPLNFVSVSNKYTVTFNWSRPATPNGIITAYNLTVFNIDTSNITSYIINVNTSQQDDDTVNRIVTGFNPYQNYNATISASTVVGYGPFTINTGRTLPEGKLYYDCF